MPIRVAVSHSAGGATKAVVRDYAKLYALSAAFRRHCLFVRDGQKCHFCIARRHLRRAAATRNLEIATRAALNV